MTKKKKIKPGGLKTLTDLIKKRAAGRARFGNVMKGSAEGYGSFVYATDGVSLFAVHASASGIAQNATWDAESDAWQRAVKTGDLDHSALSMVGPDTLGVGCVLPDLKGPSRSSAAFVPDDLWEAVAAYPAPLRKEFHPKIALDFANNRITLAGVEKASRDLVAVGIIAGIPEAERRPDMPVIVLDYHRFISALKHVGTRMNLNIGGALDAVVFQGALGFAVVMPMNAEVPTPPLRAPSVPYTLSRDRFVVVRGKKTRLKVDVAGVVSIGRSVVTRRASLEWLLSGVDGVPGLLAAGKTLAAFKKIVREINEGRDER